MIIHLFIAGAFVGGVFTLGQLVNGTFVRDSWTLIQRPFVRSGVRNPAMFRINPLLGGFRSSDSANSDQAMPVESELGRFALPQREKDFSRGLDASSVEPVHARGFDYGMILPSSLAPSNDGAQVASQIVDHSVSNWLKQDSVKNSFVGQAAHAVENTMKADVGFGGHTPESTKHNIKFQMKATDAKAKMEYTGLTNAEVSYSVTNKQVNLEVYEPIAGDSAKVVFSHTNQPSENRDMLSLRMNW